MSRYLKPYMIIDENATGEELLSIAEDKALFQEKWLQEILYEHPKILPVGLMDERFSPPICIGREIAHIDNLFVSPKGHLTVVETKLWRNPEAHRTVVAQLLDYAYTLTTWSYERLDSEVRSFMKKRSGTDLGIYQIVRENTKYLDLDEIEFHAKMEENLTDGNFALLIVGDKIHPSVTKLAETIQSAPHLQFSLGFVELQCYKLKEDSDFPVMVFPNLILKSKEVTRAVVKVIYEETKPEIEVFTPSEKSDVPKQWDRISWYEELGKRQGSDEVEVVKKFEERAAGKSFHFRWSSQRKDDRATFWVFIDEDYPCRLFGFRVDGKIELRFGDLMKFPPFDNESKRREFADRLNKMRDINLPQSLTLTGYPSVPFTALKDDKDLERFMQTIDWCVDEIKGAQDV